MSSRSLDTGTTELLCEVTDHVATVTFNRPEKRNALSDNLSPALRTILPALDNDSDVRCIMITGAGTAFCAGGDVSQMGGGALANEPFEARVEKLRQRQRTLTQKLYELKTPTVAALPGAAAGAGMSIALACDLRVAAKSAFITAAFGRIGLSGDHGGSWLLTRLVGPALAKELYFTSRRVPAAEAKELGLINTVYADDTFRSEAFEFAKSIAMSAPIALRYMKEHINQAQFLRAPEAFDLEAEHLMRTAETKDHQEAVDAFLAKREPVFKGR
ncbi:MAG: enoyl-CoA hydratase-related protein [Gammaproteobacteria bacterium]